MVALVLGDKAPRMTAYKGGSKEWGCISCWWSVLAWWSGLVEVFYTSIAKVCVGTVIGARAVATPRILKALHYSKVVIQVLLPKLTT